MTFAPGDNAASPLLDPMIGHDVVIDLRATYVCIGRLLGADAMYLALADADLHDFRDSPATREIYVYDSARLGIRRNRARVLIRLDDVVAVTLLRDVSET